MRTTLTLPGPLRDRIELAVDRGVASSRNSLIVAAVESYLDRQERAWIDAQFASMAHDEAYQVLQRQVAAGFSASDWEAWRAERDRL